VFILSRIGPPAFIDRYLLPAALGWTAVTAHLLFATGPDYGSVGSGHRWTRWVEGALFAALSLYPVAFAIAKPRVARPDVVVADTLRTLPIVVESGHDFWPLYYYSSDRRDRYHFLLDWNTAADPANFAGATQEYRLMELYSRSGYLRNSVEQLDDFVCSTPRFLVLDRPDFTLFERRIAGDPHFRSSPVGVYDGAPLRLVERLGEPCARAQHSDGSAVHSSRLMSRHG
jgi:hypothetical protein